MSELSYIAQAARAASSPYRVKWDIFYSIFRRGRSEPIYRTCSTLDARSAYVELRRKWLASLPAAFAIVLCLASPAKAGTPAQDAAARAVGTCFGTKAYELDDFKSDAGTIAEGVLGACTNELIAYGMTYRLSVATQIRELARPLAVQIVLAGRKLCAADRCGKSPR